MTLLIMGTRHRPCLSLNNGFQFSASLWSYSNKTITPTPPPCGNQGAPHPLDTKKLTSQPPIVHYVPAYNLHMTLHGTYMTNKLLLMSSTYCQVSWAQPP